jgi:superoxide dismutase, Fe-Mn family
MGDRREFLKKSALLGLAGLAGSVMGSNTVDALSSGALSGEDQLTLPQLPYAYDALEPFIDRHTMEIHHTKHHQAYIDKLKTAAASDFSVKKDLSESCMDVTDKTPALVRNNLGGHYNHSLFWQLLRPAQTATVNAPTGKLAEAINTDFKSFEEFKKEFTDKALKIFGSGWCWLLFSDGKLKIAATPNQDNPLMKLAGTQGKPLLALDVWEHAYYLKYQNKRADYINGWWNVVNWEKAASLLASK